VSRVRTARDRAHFATGAVNGEVDRAVDEGALLDLRPLAVDA
jgi:hypothetical protein